MYCSGFERERGYDMSFTQEQLKKPDIIYWPEVRWWLAEGLHTDQTLQRDVQMLYDAGFGAAEFLAMDEAGADSSRYGWGSEEWVHDSQIVIEETTRRGMGASMTSGTNWSNANLTTITPDDRAAAKELDFTSETLKAGECRSGALKKATITMPGVKVQELIAVVAVRRTGVEGKLVFLDRSNPLVLTEQVKDGALLWTAPEDGEYELLTFWIHGTGQTASPSVSVSYTINYLDRYGVDALIGYWQKEILKPQLCEQIRKNGRVQMYMDSLELLTYGRGGQFWGYHFMEEFKSRRGYDLTPYLPFIIRLSMGMFGSGSFYYESEDRQFTAALRNDLYQTMTDLYMDSMLKPLQEWLHSVGMTLRSEISYGMPFEISLPGKYVDGIETESLEFASQIDAFRNLAGPAHLYKRLYSSETGATLQNYMRGMDFYTQIIFTQFAAGVSRTVLHGYSSIAGSEESTYWPGHEGMLPIFSERFGCRQPAYRHYNDWTDMLARNQMILRQGKPRIDLAILRLDYQFNNLYMFYGNEKDTYENKLMRANEGIYWKDMTLQSMGYSYDYFAPQNLLDPDIRFTAGLLDPEGAGYQAVLIYQEEMPLEAARILLVMAREGLKIICVNGTVETLHEDEERRHAMAAVRTPFNDGGNEELAQIMKALKALPTVAQVNKQAETYQALQTLGVEPRAAFGTANQNILTTLREDEECLYLFVYNYMYTQKKAFTVQLGVSGKGKPYCIDCWTGTKEATAVYSSDGARVWTQLTLEPGETKVIALHKKEEDALYAVAADCPVSCDGDGKWYVKACESGSYTIQMSDGTERKAEVTAPANIPLTRWELTVEDWNEGEKVEILEDRGLGYVTREVYYETKKELIAVGSTELKPWKDIAQLGPEVSGVGSYKTTFRLPDDWNASNGASLSLGSTNGNSAAVYVNGIKGPPVDISRLKTDISKLLVPGENTLEVEVSSTLNNRLLARGYYETKSNPMAMTGEPDTGVAEDPEKAAAMAQIMQKMFAGFPRAKVQDYGLTGEVSLHLYTLAEAQSWERKL